MSSAYIFYYVIIIIVYVLPKKTNSRDVVLPLLPDKSALILDKASYHMRIADDTKIPKVNGWRKEDCIRWLMDKNPDFQYEDLECLTIVELVEESEKYRVKREYKVCHS